MVLLQILKGSGVVWTLLCEDGVNGHGSVSFWIDKGVASRETRELSEVTRVVVALSAVNGLHNYGDVTGAELYVVAVHEVRP